MNRRKRKLFFLFFKFCLCIRHSRAIIVYFHGSISLSVFEINILFFVLISFTTQHSQWSIPVFVSIWFSVFVLFFFFDHLFTVIQQIYTWIIQSSLSTNILFLLFNFFFLFRWTQINFIISKKKTKTKNTPIMSITYLSMTDFFFRSGERHRNMEKKMPSKNNSIGKKEQSIVIHNHNL